jgi:hypothetical protein
MHAGWTHQSSKDNQSVDSNLNRLWRFMGSRSILLQQPSAGGNLANKMPQKICDEQWLILGMKNEGNGQLSEKQVTYAAHFSMQKSSNDCNALLPVRKIFFEEKFLFYSMMSSRSGWGWKMNATVNFFL